MKAILLLLTEAFPFTINAEAFLEPEIEIAASFFDEIYILPSARVKERNDYRDISMPNVYVSPVQRNSLIIECIKSIPFILKHRGFWQDVRMFTISGLYHRFSAWRKLIYALLTERAIVSHFQHVFLNLDKNATIVVYSYWMFGEAGGALTIKRLLENEKTIAIARAHGSDIMGYPALNGYSPLKKYHIENLDMIYPISYTGKEILAKQYERYGTCNVSIINKILSIHLGIEELCESGRLLEPNIDAFTILSCSSVIPVKRVHLIIEALSEVRTKKVRWIHLGGGELLEEMKKLCREILGENISVEFRGSISRNEVMDIYKTTDVHLFINVSASEGIPVSIMEAFSFGIPALATNVGGTSELVREGINGHLLPKDLEPSELFGSINRVFNMVENDFAGYLQFRYFARQTVIEEFSLNNHKEFYRSILMKVYENQ